MSYSTSKIAHVLDLSPSRVRQLTKAGVITKPNGQHYELIDAVHAYVHYLRERVGVNRPATSESEAHHKLRLTKARADIAELESAEMTGELVQIEQAEAAWTNAAARLRQRLLALPAKLAPVAYQAGELAEVKAALCEGVYEALLELSKIEVTAVENSRSGDPGGSDQPRSGEPSAAAEPKDQRVGGPSPTP